MTRRPDIDRAARALQEFLEAVGAPTDSDPELQSTGHKVAEAFVEELLAGYDMDPAEILAEATSSRSPSLVVLRDVAATTMCPHHLMPAQGVVHLAYLPSDSVVGFGALGRLVRCFSRRLVLQEDLAHHIANALVDHVGARAAGCVVDLAPSCLTSRGSNCHGARAVTTAYAGEPTQELVHQLRSPQR